jgi:hypothetical protein
MHSMSERVKIQSERDGPGEIPNRPVLISSCRRHRYVLKYYPQGAGVMVLTIG